MSWLVIDAGNSAVKWAISDRDGHRFMGTGLEANGARQALDARLLAAWSGLRFRGVYATSVADAEVMQAIERAVLACCGRAVTWYGPQRHFEGRGLGHGVALLNGYRDPLQLGADRWHALIAACAKFPDQPLVIVSAGTATTVDCVRAQPYEAALFVGGVIAPGFALMRESLSRGTARLPLVDEAVAPSGCTTHSSGWSRTSCASSLPSSSRPRSSRRACCSPAAGRARCSGRCRARCWPSGRWRRCRSSTTWCCAASPCARTPSRRRRQPAPALPRPAAWPMPPAPPTRRCRRSSR